MIAAAQSVMTEIEAWRPRFERGELRPAGAERPSLAPDERFAVDVGRVRAAGLGHPTPAGCSTPPTGARWCWAAAAARCASGSWRSWPR